MIEKQDVKIQDLQTTDSRCTELVERHENNISLQGKQIRQLKALYLVRQTKNSNTKTMIENQDQNLWNRDK